jgi:hypothetical protein
MQSRLMSAVEAGFNVAIGYGVSFAANLVVLPLFGYAVTVRDAASIGVVFTAIALVRSYLVRRLFNRLSPRSPKCN